MQFVIHDFKVSGFKVGTVDSAAHIEGNCDISAYPVEVVDATALTGDNYDITFSVSEEGKTFTVTNTNSGTIPLAGYLPVENWPFYDLSGLQWREHLWICRE